MSNIFHTITHGKVDHDFYTKNIRQLRERNVRMLKLGFSFAAAANIVLFALTYQIDFLGELKGFYCFFTSWFIMWEILTFTVLSKSHQYAKFFYAILAGSALTMTALAGSLYSKEMCAVTYLVFLIFIPGLYVDKPICCVTTTVFSATIFCMMVLHFKSDPYIISVDIVNTAFSMVVGIVYNLYSINMQLENIQASITLKEQSTTDELTSMPNRRCFNKRIDDYFTSCGNGEIVIFMMDVDFFKKYNDRYGHLKGDECLSLIGRCLAQTAKQHGIFVSRYGGEEFVAIDDRNGSTASADIARDFVKNVEQLNILHEDSAYYLVTLSVGFACYPGSRAGSYMQLINFADEALYEAKDKGRNRFCQYEKHAD